MHASRRLIIATLCLLASPLLFAQGRGTPREVADRLSELTGNLRAGARGQGGANLQSAAAERRQLVLALRSSDPALVLGNALSAGDRAQLPANVQNLVEYDAEVDGEIEVFYEDRPTGSTLRRYVRNGRDRVEVHFASEPEELQSGQRVRVRGTRLEQELAAKGSDVTVAPLAAALPYTLGEQRTLMILVNFQNAVVEPYTPASASNLLFTTVSNFYRENSQNQTWLTGVVTSRWYTIPMNNTNCDTNAIRSYAQQAAQADGYVLSNYRRFIYAFPSNSGCSGWWGLGQVGGSTTHSWINGSLALRVLGHELGHNVGLYHAKALECGTTVLSDPCSAIEYGDPADIMGASTAHFSAFQKERLGWLDYGSSLPITTVTSSGTYTIEPYAGAGAGPKALKVLKSVDTSGRRTHFYIEHRFGVANTFDSGFAGNANVANGVVIHTGTESVGNSIYALDLTPETSSWNDLALTAAAPDFFDPVSGVTIKTLSASSAGATVQVLFGSAACVPASPTVSASPSSQTGAPGAVRSYTVTVRNNDNSGCAPSAFWVNTTPPSGWTATVSPATGLSLAPGQQGSATIAVTSSASAAPAMYNLSATATNAASSQSGSASFSYAVVGPIGVTLTTDSASYTRSQRVRVRAVVSTGTTPVAGATVAFVITKANGSRITATATTAADGSATYEYKMKPKDPVGTYTAQATATSSGQTATGQVTFTVR